MLAFDVDGVAPISFSQIQEFMDSFDVSNAVRHGSTSYLKASHIDYGIYVSGGRNNDAFAINITECFIPHLC